jgi:hypothetical protein
LLLEGQKRGLLKLEPDEKSGGLGRERRNFDELDAELVDETPALPGLCVVAYFFLAGACFAAMAWRFLCVLAAALLCFCVACLFVAFGDLSPMMFYLSCDGLLKEMVNAAERLSQVHYYRVLTSVVQQPLG